MALQSPAFETALPIYIYFDNSLTDSSISLLLFLLLFSSCLLKVRSIHNFITRRIFLVDKIRPIPVLSIDLYAVGDVRIRFAVSQARLITSGRVQRRSFLRGDVNNLNGER